MTWKKHSGQPHVPYDEVVEEALCFGWIDSQPRRVEPAGITAIATAKANGAWAALDEVENLTEPPDLASALDAIPAARTNWGAFPRSTRRGILEWIGNAKTEKTRSARIERIAAEASQNIRANQWRQPKRT